MTSESAMLHTMERLVTSLLHAQGQGTTVVTIDMGVSYRKDQYHGVFPTWDKNEAGKWEKNTEGGHRKRQVTFTGRRVSVAFPERPGWYGTLPDQIFGVEIWNDDVLQTFRSNTEWTLASIDVWEERPYILHYECQGREIQLTETARDAEWTRRAEESRRANREYAEERAARRQEDTDRRWRQLQEIPIR